MFKRLQNQQGVAIIVVIAAIIYLTMLTTDFWNDSLLGHEMALNYKRRAQGYYLAKSGVNFSKLVLYYNQKIEGELAKMKVSLSQTGFQPLYKQIPISSAGLRSMAQVLGAQSGAEDGDEEAAPTEAPAPTDDETSDFMSSGGAMSGGLMKQGEIDEFLNFDGDFDATISEEMSKYSMNYISKITSDSAGYDLYKKILLGIIMQPTFKNYFKNHENDAEELVHALSDYVDSNGVINEFDKVEKGNEATEYSDLDYGPKNASFMTLSEIRLVPGMSDDILEAIKPLVTVYQPADTINICLADQTIVDALIVYYTTYAGCTSPLDMDDKEEIEKLRTNMLTYCPDKSAVASTLNSDLGIKEKSSDEDSSQTAEEKATSSQATDCKIQFEKLITDSNTVFRIESSGIVDGVATKITAVVDASGSKVASWGTYYYQVE